MIVEKESTRNTSAVLLFIKWKRNKNRKQIVIKSCIVILRTTMSGSKLTLLRSEILNLTNL